MNTRLIPLSLSFLALTGCGKFLEKFGRLSNSTTRVEFQTGQRPSGSFSPLAVLNGGLMIYVEGADGTRRSLSGAGEGSTLAIDLPSKQGYRFTAYGWPTAGLSGSPRCGFAQKSAEEMSVASVPVSLTMNEANCSNDFFAPSNMRETSKGPLSLEFVFCANGTDLSSLTSANFLSFDCTGTKASDRFLWGDTSSSLEEGGYLSAINSVIFTTSSTASPALYIYDFDTDLQERIKRWNNGIHIYGLKVVPSTSSTSKVAYIANATNASVDDLYVYDAVNNTTTNLTNLSVPSQIAATGTATISTTVISGLSPSTGISAGDKVIGPGISGNVFVGSISGGTVTLVTGSGSPYNLTAGGTGTYIFTAPTPMVRDFKIAPNGTHIVFVQNAGWEPPTYLPVQSRYELYSVDLSSASPSPLRISGAMPPNSLGVGRCDYMPSGVCTNIQEKYQYAISPIPNASTGLTTPYVLYVADQSTPGLFKLHAASLDGSSLFNSTTPSGNPISGGATGSVNDYIDSIKIAPSGSHAAFRSHVSSGDGLWTIKLSNASPMLYTACAVPCTTTYPYFEFANSQERMAFQFGSAGPTVSLMNLATHSTTSLFTGTAGEDFIRDLRFTPDDQYVISVSSNTAGTQMIARASKYDGSSNVTFNSVRQIFPVKTNDGRFTRVYNDGTTNYVLFLSDTARQGYPDLYYGIPETAGMNLISGSGRTGTQKALTYDVTSDGTVYFAADYITGGQYELFSTTLTNNLPTPTRMDSGTAMGSIEQVEKERSPVPGHLMLQANPKTGGANVEGYTMDLSDNSFVRISRLNATNSSTLGRVKVSMARRSENLPSGPSQCLLLTAGEGLPVNKYDSTNYANLRVPLGALSAATSPFRVSIDVYPQATSCSGTSDHYEFDGLTNAESASGGAAKLVGNGSVLRFFLNDD